MNNFKPRICYIGNFLEGSGFTPQLCSQFLIRFKDQGHEVIWASDKHNKFLRLGHMLSTLMRKKKHYDLVLIDTFSGPAFLFARLCAKTSLKLGKPYIPILHGGNLPEFSKVRTTRVKNYLNNASRIVSPSSFLKKWAETISKETQIIGNPLDIELFSFKSEEELSKPIQPRIFWLRRFHKIYRPQKAIEAFQTVCHQYPEAKLVMAGEDSGELDACKNLVQLLELENNVEFAGFLTHEQMIQISRDLSIFLNTSSVDNTPRSLFEAAALGLAIVTTDPGGVPDSFTHEEDALLCPVDDTNKLTESMIRLVENQDETKSMIRKARTKAEKLSWSNILEQWEGLFEEVMRESK